MLFDLRIVRQVRMLCYFASIGQIVFSEVNRKEGRRYQVKLILLNDPDGGQPIIFTFDSKLTADTVLHTLEGYCKLSPDMREDVEKARRAASVDPISVLSNGCLFRSVDKTNPAHCIPLLVSFPSVFLLPIILARRQSNALASQCLN